MTQKRLNGTAQTTQHINVICLEKFIAISRSAKRRIINLLS